ncbi:MAG: ribonuclease P protein component [Firmicutes bacterium]|nr:ribonuclease P protein component [Bacillota bacterium]
MLSKQYRLTKRGSFTYVYNKGLRQSRGLVALVYVPSKNLKVGFSVPNKVGKAVVRNRLKRQMRAIVRGLLPNIKTAQIVFTLRQESDKLSFRGLEQKVTELLVRAKLY